MSRTVILGLTIMAAAACGSTATPTAPTPASTTEVWSNTVTVGGSRFYSFTVPLTGAVSVQLTQVQQGGVNSDAQLAVGLGAPRGVVCQTSVEVTVGAADAAILSGSQNAGVYCIRVADPGTLAATTSFSITITHPKQ